MGYVVTVKEKRCSRCHITKPAAMFSKCHTTSTGLKSECKKCHYELYYGKGNIPHGKEGNIKGLAQQNRTITEQTLREQQLTILITDNDGYGPCPLCNNKGEHARLEDYKKMSCYKCKGYRWIDLTGYRDDAWFKYLNNSTYPVTYPQEPNIESETESD